MKKLFALFAALLVTFMGVWVYKSKNPSNRPDDEAAVTKNSDWWQGSDEIPVADPNWILDPEIPSNYVPVPGEDELYMVIDDDGNIVEYRQRTKQEDGSWLWETVNPDIPNNYEPVEGLENVYRVKNEDGTYSYYKYIRNEDDTFAFVSVDENGNELPNPEEDDTSKIPDNYKHISGNVYAVYNEYGVVIGYKERKVTEDGKYYWVDAEKPVTTTEPEKSSTTKQTLTNPLPLATKPLRTSKQNVGTSPTPIMPSTATVPTPTTTTKTPTTEPQNSTATTATTTTKAPATTKEPVTVSPPIPVTPPVTIIPQTTTTRPQTTTTRPQTTTTRPQTTTTRPQTTTTTQSPVVTGAPVITPPSTYTKTETITEYQISGGWRITTQTTITYTYSADGKLLSTKKDGPVEIAREKVVDSSGDTPDPSKIASTMQAELARVKVGLLYADDVARGVLASINAERVAAGNSSLTLVTGSDAYYLSSIRAADMAIYNHADFQSPMYGTLSQMCARFNVNSKAPTELLWKTTGGQSAEAIAARLKLMNSEDLINGEFQSVGISIVSKNGYYYIDVVLLR